MGPIIEVFFVQSFVSISIFFFCFLLFAPWVGYARPCAVLSGFVAVTRKAVKAVVLSPQPTPPYPLTYATHLLTLTLTHLFYLFYSLFLVFLFTSCCFFVSLFFYPAPPPSPRVYRVKFRNSRTKIFRRTAVSDRKATAVEPQKYKK